jgi:hypothetical protein
MTNQQEYLLRQWNKNYPAIQMTRNVLGIILPARGTCQITELGNWTNLELIGSRKNIKWGILQSETALVLLLGPPGSSA